ncbi:hypothetical protein V5O48_016670 [Marasmius crinis-equi]|uniref:F-box domain-containing protein n=1 Tax=Marasmius crinis-equi TaxID=585013 RepID=A0ABR3ER32_9AGAR
MITLDGLSAELLSEILTLVHDSSRHTIFSLLRVNKAVSVASIPFVYRECTFDFSQYEHRAPDQPAQVGTPYTRSLEKLAYLLERYPGSDPAIWKGVKKTTVHSNSVIWEEEPEIIRWDDPPFTPSGGLVEKKWSLFVEFQSRVVNLREVVFDCHEQVPLVLLNILEEKHPDSRLHVKRWTRISCDVRVGDPHEEKLARSPCLQSIEARFKTGGPRMDLNLAALTRILALSPNLEEISTAVENLEAALNFPSMRKQKRSTSEKRHA